MFVNRAKIVFLVALIVLLNVMIIIYPGVALDAARYGLNLWWSRVMPGILPFVIGANVLMSLGVVRSLGRVLEPVMGRAFKVSGQGGFALIMGAISGYPIGAKIVCEMRTAGELSKNDAQRLLGFCNNAGPLFILGAVGVGMFASPQLGYLLLISHYIGAIALGLLLRLFASRKPSQSEYKKISLTKQNEPIGQILGSAVKNAMETMVVVGGFIVLFSVISALFGQLSVISYQLSVIFTGVLEMTNGLGMLSESTLTRYVVALASGFLSFGGLSILFQANSFIAKTDLNPFYYCMCKVAHGVLAGFAAFMLYPALLGSA